MIITPGQPKSINVYEPYPRGATGSIVLTKNGGEVVTLNTVRVRGTFAEFYISEEHLAAEDLPAQAQLKVNGETVRIVDLEAEVSGGNSGPDPALSTQADDAFALQRLETAGMLAALRNNGKARKDWDDSREFIYNWSALPTNPASPTLQVSGNKLYGTGTTSSPFTIFPLSENIELDTGKPFHITSFMDIGVQAAGTGNFVGLSFLSRTDTSAIGSATNEALFGFTASGLLRRIIGTGTGLTGTGQTDQTVWAHTPGRYFITFDSDGVQLSVSIRHEYDRDKNWTINYQVPNGKTIGRIVHYVADVRGLSGNSNGPTIVTYDSLQGHKTKVVGAHVLEVTAPRDFKRKGYADWASTTDTWRISLPPNYDPRKPAHLAVNFHPSQSSVATADRPWTHAKELELTETLNNMGFIVATSQDGYVLGQPNTDRYANDKSLKEMETLITWVRQNFATSQTLFYGVSMGMITATNLLARRKVANVNGMYFIDGGLSIDSIWTDPALTAYKEPVRLAYGVAVDGSDWEEKTAGRNSAERPWHDFRGIPVRLVSGESDTLAPPAMHAEFLAKLAPHVPEASQLVLPGLHAAQNHYSAGDLQQFVIRNFTY